MVHFPPQYPRLDALNAGVGAMFGKRPPDGVNAQDQTSPVGIGGCNPSTRMDLGDSATLRDM